MAAADPVAIGTQGTIGSLVRKEIEYFTKLESDRSGSARNAQPQGRMVGSGSSCSSSSRSSSSSSSTTTGNASNLHYSKRNGGFWSLTMSWPRRKKRRSSSGGIVPSCCSATEVRDHQLDGMSGFSYRILKSDFNNLHL